MDMAIAEIAYRFGMQSSAEEVLRGLDLHGRLVVITGALAGIGRATAEALLDAGADLVIAGRNPSKLEATKAELSHRRADATVHAFPLDLMSIASVDDFADAVLALKRPVNVLINNAGITGQLRRNESGIESQLMTNFIGHAVLTSRLAPALVRAEGARLVSLSSFGHHYSPVIFDDLNFEQRPYTAWASYGQSKTACVLLAVQVARQLGERGVQAFAVHPGAIMTELGADLGPDDFALAQERGSIPQPEDWKTPAQGAATSVWAATEPQLSGRGPLYLEDCHIAPVLDQPTYCYGVMPYALDAELAARLWLATERLIARPLPL
jgi:NAD(P)-dependent dehydrogenase (short-subunit alcohol dehydrogenase family)